MDLLIRIPYKKQPPAGSVAELIKSDLSQAARFAFKENPMLAKIGVIAFLVVLLLASVLMVGLPVLITQHLDMDESMVGINQSVIMAGGIIGGIAAGAMGTRLTIRQIPLFVLLGSLLLIPMGLAFLLDAPIMTTYIILTAAGALVVCITQLFTVTAITFVQRITASELIGKVMSILMMVPFIANAVGGVLFGVLFQQFESFPWIVIFAAAFVSVVTAVISRKFFKEV